MEKMLPKGLVLGIPLTELELYYTMPLSSFRQIDNQLIIRTVIPLCEIYDRTPLYLTRPIFHPFPPPDKWKPKFNASKGFVQLIEKDSLWAFKGRILEWVTESKYLTCEARGDWKLCYTFTPKFQSARTPCVERLVREQFNQIDKYCSIDAGEGKVYKPIPVSNHEYLIHKHDTVRYFQACNNDTGMHSIELQKSAAKIRIGFNCSFLCNGKDYYLPGPRNMDSVNSVLLSGPIVQRDEEMNSLSKVVTLDVDTLTLIHDTPLEPKPVHDPPLLPASPLLADLQVLRVRVQRSLQMVDNASRALQLDSRLAAHERGGWKLKNLLMIVESLIFFMLALILLLAAVRSGVYFCVAPVTFTILHRGADANPITDESSFPLNFISGNWFPFDSTDVLNFLPVAKLIVFFLILLILWTRVFAMKVMLSKHTAELTLPVRRRFHLTITFTREHRSFFHTRQQVITIRYPISRNFPPETVSVIATDHVSLFYNSVHAKTLLLVAPITCFGVNADGRYLFQFYEQVVIEWENLQWHDSFPFAFEQNAHGTAFLTVVPDPGSLRK